MRLIMLGQRCQWRVVVRTASQLLRSDPRGCQAMNPVVRMTHSGQKVVRTKVSPHLQLRQIQRSASEHELRGKSNSLVLFFPWLQASQKAIDKYCDIYHSRGLDILSIKGEMKHFLWPSTAKTVVNELLDYLNSSQVPLTTDHFFVHSTSIGSYMYTIILMEMAKNGSKYDAIRRKISGQVFDSITYGGLQKMATGVAKSSGNILLHGMIKGGISAYFALTRPWTVDFYEESVGFFKTQPLRTPILFFYSLDDPLCDSELMAEMINEWKQVQKLDVHVKCWPQSKHALHLREHPEQYIKTLDAFLQHIGMESEQQVKARL